MPRKSTKPTTLEQQQMKVAEKAAKKARRKIAEDGAEELRIKLTELIRKEIPQIEEDLQKMTPKERCDTIAKLAPYVLPKLVDTGRNNEVEETEVDELSELATRTTGNVLMS